MLLKLNMNKLTILVLLQFSKVMIRFFLILIAVFAFTPCRYFFINLLLLYLKANTLKFGWIQKIYSLNVLQLIYRRLSLFLTLLLHYFRNTPSSSLRNV